MTAISMLYLSDEKHIQLKDTFDCMLFNQFFWHVKFMSILDFLCKFGIHNNQHNHHFAVESWNVDIFVFFCKTIDYFEINKNEGMRLQ